jgi:hypothetical protein
MASIRKIIKVFLASPSDLTDERRAAKGVVDEINALLGEEFGHQIELVGWEDTVSVFGRPQAVINRELEQCELFVGMLYRKWGTAPDKGAGPFTSGFEEEFRTSVARRESSGRPELSLYFRDIEPEHLVDPGEQLKKVLAFRDELVREKQLLFETFRDVSDFERKLRRRLISYIRQLRSDELTKAASALRAPESSDATSATATNEVASNPLSDEGAAFLKSLISIASSSSTDDPIPSDAIARFRLLSLIVGNHENDKRSLGVHDANLLFVSSFSASLGRTEVYGLLESGLAHYAEHSCPVWHWLSKLDGWKTGMLAVYSSLSSYPTRQQNALNAMRLVGSPLPDSDFLNRSILFKTWFSKESSSRVRVAALEFLGAHGLARDADVIKRELARNDSQTSSAASDALIRVHLRASRTNALKEIFNLKPVRVSADLAVELFQEQEAITDEELVQSLEMPSVEIRRSAVKEMVRRKTLSEQLANKLAEDSEGEIRYWAIVELAKEGKKFSAEEARQFLVKQDFRRGLFFPAIGGRADGEDWLTKFNSWNTQSLSDRELQTKFEETIFFSIDAYKTYMGRHFERFASEIRKDVSEAYVGKFAEFLTYLSTVDASQSDLVSKAQKLEVLYRTQATTAGLSVLCTHGRQRDIAVVRQAMDSGSTEYVDEAVKFISKFGEWDDIERLVKFSQLSPGGNLYSVLMSEEPARIALVSEAIYRLVRTRLVELNPNVLPTGLLAAFLARVSLSEWRKLPNNALFGFFAVKDERARRIASLLCVASMSKRKVGELLGRYLESETYFYNVAHWLDFGVSVPSDVLAPACRRALDADRRALLLT